MEHIGVSIIVPVYNARDHLEQCLESLVRQTLENDEIIVIDDGSTDGSQRIIGEFAEKHPHIRAYFQENMGVAKTRSRGLRLARGDYIGWVDSDDFVEPDMFERLYRAAVEEKADVVLCDYSFYPAQVRTKEKWYKEYKGAVDWRFIERNTQQWNKLVRRELLERVNMVHWMEYCGEGAYALALIFANGIVSIDRPLYHYRVGHASLSGSLSNTDWYVGNVLRAERQGEAIRANGLEAQWGEYYEYRAIYALLQAVVVAARNGEEEVYQRQKSKLLRLDWDQNPYTKRVLDANHGKLKSFVLRRIIPWNYSVARIIAKMAL